MNDDVDQLLGFLRGTKTSESLSADLRSSLYVPTSRSGESEYVEGAVIGALTEGRHVVVAGSAGGGKTMFLDVIVERLRARPDAVVCVVRPEDDLDVSIPQERTDQRLIFVVPDLTEYPTGERGRRLSKAAQQGTVLLAGNEGAIQDGALEWPFDDVLADLHNMQSGGLPSSMERPVVIDLAGVNPLDVALPRLLGHDLLHEAARRWETDGAAANQVGRCADYRYCPRLQALGQLRDPTRAQAIADVMKSALGPGEVLFRDVWDMLSDLFLGGDCAGEVPTAPWFWRLFHGDSVLSMRLSEVLSPEHLALPALSPALWFGDWQEIRRALGGAEGFVKLTSSPRDLNGQSSGLRPQASQGMSWLRLQAAFLNVGVETSVAGVVAGLVGTGMGSLAMNIASHDKTALTRSLNAYHRLRSASVADRDDLELWLDLAMERRTERSRNMVMLGRVPATRLDLRRSETVANLVGVSYPGARLFLSFVATEHGPSLAVDERLLEALVRGRATRASNRSNDDVDAALTAFNARLAECLTDEESRELSVLQFSNAYVELQLLNWRVDLISRSLVRLA